MRAVAIIPARYASSRFPGKPLAPLLGRPMIAWVAQAAARAVGQEQVFVATDDERIRTEVQRHGFRAIMTPSDLLTGTDRVACAAEGIPADIYVNVQGDEPLLDPESIRKVIGRKEALPGSVVNAMARISPQEDAANVNLPKVAFSEASRMVYISRLPVPGSKKGPADGVARYKQVCIYAFERAQLEKFRALGRKSALEQIEDIEILRFIDLGIPVQMCEVAAGSLAVDVPADIVKVEAALRRMGYA